MYLVGRPQPKRDNSHPMPLSVFFKEGGSSWRSRQDDSFCDGFRMPAHHDAIHAHHGPAFESRQGRKARGVGHPAQRALWRFGWHRWRSVGLVKQAAAPRMSADAGSWARPASAPRSCRGALGPCPATDGRSTRASSSPAVSQQHERSAVTSKTVASIIMTYRS